MPKTEEREEEEREGDAETEDEKDRRTLKDIIREELTSFFKDDEDEEEEEKPSIKKEGGRKPLRIRDEVREALGEFFQFEDGDEDEDEKETVVGRKTRTEPRTEDEGFLRKLIREVFTEEKERESHAREHEALKEPKRDKVPAKSVGPLARMAGWGNE